MRRAGDSAKKIGARRLDRLRALLPPFAAEQKQREADAKRAAQAMERAHGAGGKLVNILVEAASVASELPSVVGQRVGRRPAPDGLLRLGVEDIHDDCTIL